ncbi:hypothetical protein EDF56_11179 [Novosphingobium sp. PhB165]|uniref:hypothetical protein n=1 Tax=Novosphingobium sp. PhB165 TaxID=2485105 RepID=UPI0010453D3A|nr:hypothetical protein [Novosphingobium sp. PhB165]TCM15032.1 hypothetical protein EDF56_11179 [Novosphingobium sp. PhB165]
MLDLETLFRHGPPRRTARFARVALPPFSTPVPRVALVLVLGWLPLILMTLATQPRLLSDLGWDIAVHARSAVAAPLLVVAYASCGRRLGLIAGNFAHAGLLDEKGREDLRAELAISHRLLDSRVVEGITILLAVVMATATFRGMTGSPNMAAWALQDGRQGTLSMAGAWQFAVSLPLLLTLMLGWLWRIAIWARLLMRISRFDLNLIASHPDQCGGLGFLGQSLRAFAAFGMALGAIAAGRLAHEHLAGKSNSFNDGLLAGGSVVVVAILCVGPLCAFSGRMMDTWRRGSMVYGALAMRLGTKLEAAWLEPLLPVRRGASDEVRAKEAQPGGDDAGEPQEILSAPDFSAAADLYTVVASVQSMQFIPVDTRSVIMLALATLLPFVAALFLTMPFDLVLQTLKSLLM